MQALLVLEDGRTFRGQAFGAPGTQVGEICFNTSMTGYQEVLTDPSYHGQIVAMTCPLIGNYGVNPLDSESDRPHVRGFVIEELSPVTSSWRSTGDLDQYLRQHGVTGIQGIDTRALTRHLRTRGAMNACLTTEITDPAAAHRLAAQAEGVTGMDFVRNVTTPQPYLWDTDGSQSRLWAIPNPSAPPEIAQPELPPVKYRIAAYDFGIKRNILRRLRQAGFQVRVLPAHATAEEALADKPDGVFLSNGPGDPSAIPYAHQAVRDLIGKVPLFGICLGHQILGYSYGGNTFKLKFGHRGGNQPVQDLRTGAVSITSQNHGFAVDPGSLPSHIEVTHLNLNDGTVEGMRHKNEPVFSVQYHPEAAPGPHDASYFFNEFTTLIETA